MLAVRKERNVLLSATTCLFSEQQRAVTEANSMELGVEGRPSVSTHIDCYVPALITVSRCMTHFAAPFRWPQPLDTRQLSIYCCHSVTGPADCVSWLANIMAALLSLALPLHHLTTATIKSDLYQEWRVCYNTPCDNYIISVSTVTTKLSKPELIIGMPM